MRLALLSDVHANAPAMHAVAAAIEQADVDAVIVSGDIVGYYYWPKQVLSQLAALDARMIRGNHEDALSAARRDVGGSDGGPPSWGTAIEVCLSELSRGELDDLEALPRTRVETTAQGSIFVCHGSPEDPVRYVYPDTPDADLATMAPPGHRWVVMGHTHYPMRRDVDGVTFVNPGSVGQPRNGVPGAAWAILDSDDGSVEFRVEAYEWAQVQREARERDPGLPYLQDVLGRRR